VQGARIVGRVDGHYMPGKDRSGVQAGVHLHDSDAGLAIAREYRALDRCSAAPPRQKGGVDIERAVRRDLEERPRKDEAIGCHDERIRACRGDALERAQILRLEDGQAARHGKPLYGALRRLEAAAGGAVRLGENQRDFVPRLEQPRQRPLGEGRGTGED
jgi:hypothetical protein